MAAEQYLAAATAALQALDRERIRAGAELLAETIAGGRTIFAFGASHAFMVAEEFQGRGIASFLLEYMTEIAKEHGYQGFRADVLVSNSPMIRVIERGPYVVRKQVSDGVLTLTWRFDELKTNVQWGR